MRVVYIANDETQFDDGFDCEDYEWRLNHPGEEYPEELQEEQELKLTK